MLLDIPDFVSRCDAYCRITNRKRTWLSKRLFADTNRIDDLAKQQSDVGVNRMKRAVDELRNLEDAAGITSLRAPRAPRERAV